MDQQPSFQSGSRERNIERSLHAIHVSIPPLPPPCVLRGHGTELARAQSTQSRTRYGSLLIID